MKHCTLLLILLLFATATQAKDGDYPYKNYPYKNPALPVDVRVQDLLGRMTLEEKIGQIRCTMAWPYAERMGKNARVTEKFETDIRDNHIGNLWATFRADPWTRRTLDSGLTPEMAARVSNEMQRFALQKTRLGIPLFLAEEAPHGHMAIGCTVFPTGLGLAATWDTALMREIGLCVGREVRSSGARLSLGPVVDLARDPRWSRMEETFGEDPTLTGHMASALVAGMAGPQVPESQRVMATLKHFVGYGTTEGGQNGAPSVVSHRDLEQNFMAPFRQAIDSGALGVMTSYSAIDCVPMTANGNLIGRVLRGKWGFQGLVISDLYAIDCMYSQHHTCASLQEAAIKALKAGVDIDLGGEAYATLADAVRTGKCPESLVDTTVAHVLRWKMRMRLFDHPYVDVKAARNVRTAADIALARRAARESVTLLKNDSRLLPLGRDVRVLVTGPNADTPYNQLGDYTAPQRRSDVRTILDGIKASLPAGQVTYVKGCGIRDTTQCDIDAAVAAARKADVIIACVGGSSARDFKTSYEETGAATAAAQTVSDMDCGEGMDRATLSLLGKQDELLRALKATGKPMVVIYVEGRTLDMRWAAENAGALLLAYYPGEAGGDGVADVIFGDYNPAGRLPVSVPRDVGQIPCYYNRKAPVWHDYTDMSAQPLYPFGYGLSYTTFSYGNLSVTKASDGGCDVAFDLTNTGDRDGEEVAQVYIHDLVASTVQPTEQLKEWRKVMLKAGETKHVSIHMPYDDFSIVNSGIQHVVEPGDFTIMVGPNAADLPLQSTFTIAK